MRAARIILAIFLFVAQLSTSQQQKQTSSISGTVVADPGGKPLSGAAVVIVDDQQHESRYSTTTDDKGQFSFSNLSAGSYAVDLKKDGYVQTHESEVLLTVASGQELSGLIFRMLTTGVITGHLVDEKGEPVRRATVSAITRLYLKHKHSLPGGYSETDDRGEFRIFDLRPGKYVVGAEIPQNFGDQLPQQKNATSEMNYAATYYPGTTEQDQAVAVVVQPGQEAVADFGLQKIRTVSVSGKILGKTGSSYESRGLILLQPVGESGKEYEGEISDGHFSINHVPPGEYTLIAFVWTKDSVDANSSADELSMARAKLTASQKISVGENGTSNVLIQVGGTASLRGKIVADSRPAPPYERLYVSLISWELPTDKTFFGIGGTRSARVRPDGSFEMKNIAAGKYQILISADSDGLEDWYLKMAKAGSQDVTDSGLPVQADAQTQLEIVIGSDGATVSGVVRNDKGLPVPSATVIAVPPSMGMNRSDLYQQAYSDQNGKFILRGLCPHDYRLFAWRDIDPAGAYDPDLISKYNTESKKLQVTAGEHANVDLRAISLPADDY